MEQALFFQVTSIGTMLILLRFLMVLVFYPLIGLFTRFAHDLRMRMK